MYCKVSLLAVNGTIFDDEAAGAGLQDGGVFATARLTKRKSFECGRLLTGIRIISAKLKVVIM